MAAYDTLRAAIDSYIKANGNKEITGTVLNDILNAMVSALGADTRFAGVAIPTTNPGNPEGNVVYFASQAGTYSNFGGIVLPLGIHILVWNGTVWTSQTWFSVDNTPTQNSQNLATSGGILQAIVDAVGVERLRAIGAEVTSCSFDGTTKKISFFNSADDTLFQLDATAFVIDGMVSDVKIEDGNLVIQFNTDAGKQDIEIPLTDIFNPANYYTKTAIDALLALYYTKTETDALLTAINNKLADGCLYRGMAEPTTNPPTPTTKVFYIATKAGTYTNFGNIAVTEGITILKYDGSNWSKEQISYSDGVFDISAYNGTSYAELSAALGTDGAYIPQNLRKGGMSVKFVQSSDNKYVQYRLMSDSFNTTVANWQGVDDEPHGNSKNLIESGVVAQVVNSLELQENYTKVEVGSIDFNGIDIADNSRTRFVDYFSITANPSISVKVNGIEKTTTQRFYSSNTPESYIGNSYTSSANYVRVVIISNTQINGVELTIDNTIYYSDRYKKSATKTDVLKCLVATDSNFTKPIPALLSYIAKLDIDTTKEYYIRYCGGINGGNNGLLRVYDQNDNITDRADFDISALPVIHRIETKNFVFTIDNSLIEPNSESIYKEYNYHLFNNSYKYKDAELYKKTIEPIYQDNITQNYRLTIPLLLTDYIGKSVCIKGNSSRDDDVYTIYECDDSGSLIADRILARFPAGAVSDNFVIPANGYIRVFTTKNPSTTGTLDFYLYVAECLLPRVERSEKRIEDIDYHIEDIDYHINGNILNFSNQSPDLTSNLSRLITLTGYAGKELVLDVYSLYFKNHDIHSTIKIFECTDEGRLISDRVLTTGIVNEIPCIFTVPANEYVWLYTVYNDSSASSAKYDIHIYDRNSIKGDEADIVNKLQECTNGILDINNKKTLYGKNIVCFGDSITEFSYKGMRYSDYLAQIADANVINVGVGGTRLSQRGLFYEVFDENKTYEVDDYCIHTENDNTRIYRFTSQHTGSWNSGDAVVESNSNKAYSNIDVINMIKCACGERDVADLLAAAQILYQAESDDNRDIIERLAGIDWSTIQYVTIFAGTNDWTAGTDIGDSGSTDVSCVCGAINEIMRALLHTYPHLQLYWFTPILRVQVPNFSSGVQYNVDDVCEYNNTNYKFINAHRGAWNSNDVVQISAYEARKPEYFSDIKTNSDGVTLREYSADIYEEVKLNHIPVCDMYNTLGWNRYNFSQYFRDMDGTHPYKGFKQLAEKIYKFINSN